MGGSFEYRQFSRFYKDMKRTYRDFDDFLRKFIYKQALIVLGKTKQTTPVDTGALEGSWTIKDIKVSAVSVEATIYNPMEYASWIEYGHAIKDRPEDWVMGYFMLTIPMEEMRNQMPARFARAFKAFLKQHNVG